MKIYESIVDLVGNTPIIKLSKFQASSGMTSNIFGKAEFFNPAGSVKDRIALAMIQDAEKSGVLKPGATIIEPTSGNTGIGLASIGVSRGYRVILTMPETMSVERRNLLIAYGAEIVLTDGAKGMSGAIAEAEKLKNTIEGSVILNQFENKSNPETHEKTTGAEILEAMEGKVDFLIAGVGTGGTLSGTGKYLKSKNPKIKVIAVEPKSSPLISEGKAGGHKIQGIGANFIPKTLNREIIDEVITVADAEAFECRKLLAATEGLLVGISSGAALSAAVQAGKRPENEGKNIVVILPDTGERYLSVLG